MTTQLSPETRTNLIAAARKDLQGDTYATDAIQILINLDETDAIPAIIEFGIKEFNNKSVGDRALERILKHAQSNDEFLNAAVTRLVDASAWLAENVDEDKDTERLARIRSRLLQIIDAASDALTPAILSTIATIFENSIFRPDCYIAAAILHKHGWRFDTPDLEVHKLLLMDACDDIRKSTFAVEGLRTLVNTLKQPSDSRRTALKLLEELDTDWWVQHQLNTDEKSGVNLRRINEVLFPPPPKPCWFVNRNTGEISEGTEDDPVPAGHDVANTLDEAEAESRYWKSVTEEEDEIAQSTPTEKEPEPWEAFDGEETVKIIVYDAYQTADVVKQVSYLKANGWRIVSHIWQDNYVGKYQFVLERDVPVSTNGTVMETKSV